MDAPPIRIIELRRQLANAIDSIESLANSSNDQLLAQHQNTESTLTELESTLQTVQNPKYLKRIISKQHKLERKKQQKEQQKSPQPSSSQKLRIRELSRLVEKLTQLRNIRRKRLEAKGHFFSEDGNEFFEKVKSWNAEQENQKLVEEKEFPTNEEKTLYIHPEDKWNNKGLFDKKAYEYWSQGYQNTDNLRRIRTHWDYYIYDNVDESNGNSSRQDKIPPTWVPPAPPSSWIWATHLVNQSP
ncbi:hypothetical protein BDA99DRAFT_532109 [Phascolomyces articulosus]|uniref:Uncharacterized protein n=1 Tax=Phascolomyces articulosus TaxID=60185 RepID=A0AAD5KWC9_9FUNG|nr:hypothetical protein BDA99DRAFT_532109 [Phascolomyces articulosus]